MGTYYVQTALGSNNCHNFLSLGKGINYTETAFEKKKVAKTILFATCFLIIFSINTGPPWRLNSQNLETVFIAPQTNASWLYIGMPLSSKLHVGTSISEIGLASRTPVKSCAVSQHIIQKFTHIKELYKMKVLFSRKP